MFDKPYKLKTFKLLSYKRIRLYNGFERVIQKEYFQDGLQPRICNIIPPIPRVDL